MTGSRGSSGGDEHDDDAPSSWRPAPASHRTADAPSSWRPAPPSHRTADAGPPAPSSWRPAPASHRTADAGPPAPSWRPAPASHRTADAGPPALRPELAPGASFGRFRIERLLGQGGMGRVYEARDCSLERPVALKVLRAREGAGRDETMRRLLREARAVAALRHENVVSIYEAGECEGTPYIAMELLEGATLRRHVADPAATLERRLGWSLEVASALAAAHEAGLVHRDVKPENIFVCEGGRAKLLDFGVAKRGPAPPEPGAAEAEPSSLRTVEGRAVGTPRYMPPEQRAGRSADARSDQYAWALVTYELLGGRPEDAASPGAAARLLAAAPRLSPRAAAALARALAPEPAARFPSMREAIAALRDPAPRRRRRLALAGASLAALAGVAAFLLRDRLPAIAPERASLAPPCALEGDGDGSGDGSGDGNGDGNGNGNGNGDGDGNGNGNGNGLVTPGGPVPDALVPWSRGDELLLYGTFRDGSRVPSGLTRTRLRRAGASLAFGPFKPYEPFLGVVSPAGRSLAAAFWRGEEVVAAYSDELGSLGVWGPRGPVSALRLDLASLGLATVTVGETLFGASVGAPKGGSGLELGLAVLNPDSSPRYEVLHRAGPHAIRAPAALAAAGRRAVVAFAADDRVLAIAFDERGQRAGEAVELARGDVGAPAIAAAGASALVAWPQRRGADGAYSVYVAALPLDGRPAGPARAIGRLGPSALPPALAARGDGAVVAWLDGADGADGHVVIAALAADATPLTRPLTLAAPGGARSLALSPRPGGAWITWLEGATAPRVRVGSLRCGPP